MTKYFFANWKIYLGLAESYRLAQGIKSEVVTDHSSSVTMGIAATALAIPELITIFKGSPVHVGTQNISWENKGAYTGEISAIAAKEIGCSFTLVGHSERRHAAKEDNSLIPARTTRALEQNLSVIYCVGETLEQRKKGESNAAIREQLQSLFKLENLHSNLSAASLLPTVFIAYEPVWAIHGTGEQASLKDIADASHFINELIAKENFSTKPVVIYGGSVTAKSVAEILTESSMQGFLVGNASTKLDSVAAIYSEMQKRV